MSGLKNKYEEIYKRRFATSFPGIHTTIVSHIKDRIEGKRVLDIGCGAGRLSFFASLFAREVLSFDFSLEAIEVARFMANGLEIKNVLFMVDDAEEPTWQKDCFDAVLLSEVIEHVTDPGKLLYRIAGVMNKGSCLVVSCPSFWNFRGAVYNTLLSLFRLPMSLTDIRQVTPADMEKWAKEAGFSIKERIGVLYELGWLREAFFDLRRRIPLAVRDKGIKNGVDYDGLNRFLDEFSERNSEFIEHLVREGVLKVVRREFHFNVSRERFGKRFEEVRDYLSDSVGMESNYYTSIHPYNLMGGGVIYLMDKT
jgi:2-polyprenyl-3-methyl-5-hydroxy-6-metoxy-1,4-benzoquinol methylase